MSRFPGFPTKIVDHGGLKLEVPTHWSSGRKQDGRWWAGDSSEATTIYTSIESLGVWDKTDIEVARPTINTEPYVTQTVDFLRTIPLVGEIEIDRIQSGYVIHAVQDYEEAGERLRSYRWYSITGRTEYVTCVRFILVVRPDVADDAEVAWLFDHFRSKAHEVDTFARTPGGSDALALKDLSIDDLFGIRIPDDWAYDTFEREGIRGVWCYPRDTRLGKLLICYEHGQLKDEHAEGRDPDITNKLADLRDLHFVEDDERRRLSRSRYAAPLGVILRLIDDEKPRPYAEEEFDLFYVRYYQWYYIVAGRRDYLVAFLSLKIPLRCIDQPEAAETVALMEREINALRLLPAFDAVTGS
jgi:hypothetical protein